MKKLGLLIYASITLLTFTEVIAATCANQDSGFYIKGNAGGSFSQNANFQVHGLGGFPDPNNDFSQKIDNAVVAELGVGYRINTYFRTDLTIAGRWGFNYDKVFSNADRHRTFNIVNTTLMANLYLDFRELNNSMFGIFNPYLGAGIGGALNRTKDYTTKVISQPIENHIASNDNTAFSWQFMLGSSVDLTDHFQLDFGYRFVNLGKIQVGTKSTTEPGLKLAQLETGTLVGTNEIYLGIRYNFN